MTTDEAIAAMARWAIWAAYEAWAEQGHENLPDIGAHDFDAVCAKIEEILPSATTMPDYTTALDTLVARVDDEPDLEGTP